MLWSQYGVWLVPLLKLQEQLKKNKQFLNVLSYKVVFPYEFGDMFSITANSARQIRFNNKPNKIMGRPAPQESNLWFVSKQELRHRPQWRPTAMTKITEAVNL